MNWSAQESNQWEMFRMTMKFYSEFECVYVYMFVLFDERHSPTGLHQIEIPKKNRNFSHQLISTTVCDARQRI